jgi:hypothetical protein
MWVRLSIDRHACPSLLDDLDIRGVDVGVSLDEVVTDDGGEKFDRCDWVLFCEDIARLLLSIGCYYNGVVGFGVAGGLVSLIYIG